MKLKTDHIYKIGERVIYEGEEWVVEDIYGRRLEQYGIGNDARYRGAKESDLTKAKEPVKAYCYKSNLGSFIWFDHSHDLTEGGAYTRVPELDIGGES